MWKGFQTGEFIIQTDDPNVQAKLKRRKSAVIFGQGMNCNQHSWKITFSDQRAAKESLGVKATT